jgi:hypothetical protein
MGLETVEFILAGEDAFKITLEDAETERCATVGDLEQLIVSKLERAGRSEPNVFDIIKAILVRDWGHPSWNIRRGTSFHDDLGFR